MIVVGAGHNGLVCAAYLARAGLRTLLLEARTSVGGVAGSERFAGATVNVCNCDHVTFRTTPIARRARPRPLRSALPGHRSRPGRRRRGRAGRRGRQWHDVERTIDGLAATLSGRGRRVPALPSAGQTGGRADRRRRDRAADRLVADACRPASPARRGQRGVPVEPAQRRRGDAVVLPRDALLGPGWCPGRSCGA